jgi:hypothetical protein
MKILKSFFLFCYELQFVVDLENRHRSIHNDFQLVQLILLYMDDNESQQNEIPDEKNLK